MGPDLTCQCLPLFMRKPLFPASPTVEMDFTAGYHVCLVFEKSYFHFSDVRRIYTLFFFIPLLIFSGKVRGLFDYVSSERFFQNPVPVRPQATLLHFLREFKVC